MLLADVFALAIMMTLGSLVATDTAPGRALIYAIQRRRHQRRLSRSIVTDRSNHGPRHPGRVLREAA
jgi:hypothetical protein